MVVVVLFMCVLSRVWLFVTPWTVARQAPLSMGFLKQESWSEVPFPPTGDLPNREMELGSPTSPAWAGAFLNTEPSDFYYYLKSGIVTLFLRIFG